jgi:Spy/CpxP family protein refolding chaperone
MNKVVRMGAVAVVSVCVASGMAVAAGPGEGLRPGGMRGEPGRGGGGGGGMAGLDAGDGRILRMLDSARFAKEAGVSQAQVAEIKAKLEVLRKEQIDLRAELEKAGLEQAKLLAEKSMDEEVLLAAVDKTSSVSARMARNRIKQLLVMRKILTPEQVEKLYGMMNEQRMGKRKGDAEGGAPQAPGGATKESEGTPAPAKEAGAPAVVPAEPAKPAAPAANP